MQTMDMSYVEKQCVQACPSVSKRFQALDWLLTAHKYIIGFQN